MKHKKSTTKSLRMTPAEIEAANGITREASRKQKQKYENRVGCGNCHKNIQVKDAETCEVCGRMLCGYCGNFCADHKPEKGKDSAKETVVETISPKVQAILPSV